MNQPNLVLFLLEAAIVHHGEDCKLEADKPELLLNVVSLCYPNTQITVETTENNSSYQHIITIEKPDNTFEYIKVSYCLSSYGNSNAYSVVAKFVNKAVKTVTVYE